MRGMKGRPFRSYSPDYAPMIHKDEDDEDLDPKAYYASVDQIWYDNFFENWIKSLVNVQ
jgi:hypothetical protein